MKHEQPTELITIPSVKTKTRRTYTVSWWINSYSFNEESQSMEPRRVMHSKTYLTKRGAYRHMAWGYVFGRRDALGCSSGSCGCSTIESFDESGPVEKLCKYCSTESVTRIVDRLARWLMWRDKRRGET